MEREKGPVEILCKEIDFRFERHMEAALILVAFVRVLVSEVADIRQMHASIAGITKTLTLADPDAMICRAAEAHAFIRGVAPEDAYPCDHLIDMLSSCVSAIRFGLEKPCHSRHAAQAANHIWKHKYGVSLFDNFTPAWQKDWARAMLQEAVLSLALRGS
jgi:hypothetical protein